LDPAAEKYLRGLEERGKAVPILEAEPELDNWQRVLVNDYQTLRATATPGEPLRMGDVLAYGNTFAVIDVAAWIDTLIAADAVYIETFMAKTKQVGRKK